MQTENRQAERAETDSTLETLERSECFRLMATVPIGRVVYAAHNVPSIQPVNFALDGEDVLISTGRGMTMFATLRGAVVAFEVDQFDLETRTGWNVVVTGEATWIHDAAELARLGDLPPQPWAPGRGENVLRIRPDRVQGRRIVRPQ